MWLTALKTSLDMLYKLAVIIAVAFAIWAFIYSIQPMFASQLELDKKSEALKALTQEAEEQRLKTEAAKATAEQLKAEAEQLKVQAKKIVAEVAKLEQQRQALNAQYAQLQQDHAAVKNELAAVKSDLEREQDNLFALNVKRFSDKVFQQYLAKMNDPGFSVIDYSRTVLNSDIFANEPNRAELKKYLGAYINQYKSLPSNEVPGFVAGMQFKYVLEKLQKEKAAAVKRQL